MTNKLREYVDALHETGMSKEDIAAEALTTPIQQGLPTTWSDSAGKVHLQGAPTQIKTASANEVAQYAHAPRVVCGTCKHFDVSPAARKKLGAERFAERLLHDEKWKLKYLGVPLEHVGLCGASQGSRATTSISAAGECAGYKPTRFSEGK